jgi:hypothetical protein
MTILGHQLASEKSSARFAIPGERIFIIFSSVVLCAPIALEGNIRNYLEGKLILNTRNVFKA